jgi:hypothetical protein
VAEAADWRSELHSDLSYLRYRSRRVVSALEVDRRGPLGLSRYYDMLLSCGHVYERRVNKNPHRGTGREPPRWVHCRKCAQGPDENERARLEWPDDVPRYGMTPDGFALRWSVGW